MEELRVLAAPLWQESDLLDDDLLPFLEGLEDVGVDGLLLAQLETTHGDRHPPSDQRLQLGGPGLAPLGGLRSVSD